MTMRYLGLLLLILIPFLSYSQCDNLMGFEANGDTLIVQYEDISYVQEIGNKTFIEFLNNRKSLYADNTFNQIINEGCGCFLSVIDSQGRVLGLSKRNIFQITVDKIGRPYILIKSDQTRRLYVEQTLADMWADLTSCVNAAGGGANFELQADYGTGELVLVEVGVGEAGRISIYQFVTNYLTAFGPDDLDEQTLSISGNTLSISNGNSIVLNGLSDDQILTLIGTQLTIEDGNTVDLASINTDAQTLTLNFDQLSISNGNAIDLSGIDNQILSIVGDQLTIEDGNTVTIPTSSPGTDDQTLSISGIDLTIEDGNTVSLPDYTIADDVTNSSGTDLFQIRLLGGPGPGIPFVSLWEGPYVDIYDDLGIPTLTLDTVGIQADWNEVDVNSPRYIRNKPGLGGSDNLGNHIATQALDMSAFTINSLPNPVSDSQAVNKLYLDGLDANNVKLTGDQTIAGNKTFSGLAQFNNDVNISGTTTFTNAPNAPQMFISDPPADPDHVVNLAYFNANAGGTDDQTLSITNLDITIEDGNTISLPNYSIADGVNNSGGTDFFQVELTGVPGPDPFVSLWEGPYVDIYDDLGTPTLTLDTVGIQADWNEANVNSPRYIRNKPASVGSDGVVSNVTFDGTNMNFTGSNGGFNGAVDISSLAGGSLPTQTNQEGNYLTTDGTAASWEDVRTKTDLRIIPDDGRLNGHLKDIFAVSYITDTTGEVIDRLYDITVESVVGSYFTTNMVDWPNDINPLPSGEKWAIYKTTNTVNDPFPVAVVDSFDSSNGRIYFSTAGITGGSAPVVSDVVEFYNPFVNMQNMRGTGPLLEGFLNEGGAYNSTGYTVDFEQPSDHFRKTDGTHVIGLNVRVTGSLNSAIGFAETKDFENFTIIDPIIRGDTITGVTRLGYNAILEWDNPNSDSLYFVNLFMHVDGDGDDDPYFQVMDENYNEIMPYQQLPIRNYNTSDTSLQIFDAVVYEGKIRMTGWEWWPAISAADNRLAVELTFNTSDISKLLDGTAKSTRKVIHDGATGTGLMDSQIDTWRYVPYEGKLHAIHTYYDRSVDHMTYNNRGYMISTLGDNDEWIHDNTGRIMAAATQWDRIDNATYEWQEDHMGGTPMMIRDNGKWRWICSMKSNTANTYRTAGYNLIDHSKEDIYNPESLPRLNDVQANNLTGLLGGEIFYSTDQNDVLFYNGNTTSWVSTSGGGGGSDNLGNHIATQNLNMNNNRIVNVTDPVDNQDAATKAYVDANSGGQFAVSGSNIYNTNAGNVGIGTNVPDTKLHVEGRVYIDPNNVASANATRLLDIVENNTSTTRDVYPTLTIRNRSRSTGPGVDPSLADLGFFADDGVVKGYLRGDGLGSYFPTSGWGLAGITNHNFYITTNDLPRFSILNTGEVGVGTNTPSAPLEVVGDVYLSNVGTGVIQKSPDGNCWRITVDNAGVLTATSITCP